MYVFFYVMLCYVIYFFWDGDGGSERKGSMHPAGKKINLVSLNVVIVKNLKKKDLVARAFLL